MNYDEGCVRAAPYEGESKYIAHYIGEGEVCIKKRLLLRFFKSTDLGGM